MGVPHREGRLAELPAASLELGSRARVLLLSQKIAPKVHPPILCESSALAYRRSSNAVPSQVRVSGSRTSWSVAGATRLRRHVAAS